MASDNAHAAGAHRGPTTATYLSIALFLTVVTAIEVAIYYIDPIKHSPFFVPALLILSSLKFFAVVGFYMHLKYDHRIFRGLFGGPFLIAITTIIALLFLFGHITLSARG
jgi:cytochrome c oxidase subunit 4